MRVFCEPGDRRGNAYSPDFGHMNAELQKLRTPEQITPGDPGAKCSPQQSYPSGSDSQSSARLAASQPAPRRDQADAAETAQTHVPPKPKRSNPTPRAPWKGVPVPESDIDSMLGHLAAIAEAYPCSSFGPVNRTTARDLVAAAKLSDPDANAAHVSEFLAWKFRQKRPHPYERGIETFGGMLTMVAEDFGAWFSKQRKPVQEIPLPLENTPTPQGEQNSSDQEITMAETAEAISTEVPQPLPRTTGTDGQPASIASCSCLGQGHRIDDTGSEELAGVTVRTIALVPCRCTKGREIGFARLAAMEKKIANERGSGWVAAHHPVESTER